MSGVSAQLRPPVPGATGLRRGNHYRIELLPANPVMSVAAALDTASRHWATGKLGVAPALCIVVPTFNERDNVDVLIDRLDQVLAGTDWEVVFVDDNSPDETARRVRQIALRDVRIRCIRRIGRRGLSSACIEGMLSTSAQLVAVMDGDLQHDESLLPCMRDSLMHGPADMVIASRYIQDGRSDGLSAHRKRLSLFGVGLAKRLIKCAVADPLSGFFMLRRELIDQVAPRLAGTGTKILIDILMSSPQPLKVTELPYRFRARYRGRSKLDLFTALEYVLLLAEKASRGFFSRRLLLFGIVGASGVVINLIVLRSCLLVGGVGFTTADSVATATAMVWNFFLNNALTYRDCRLVGWQAVRGLASFMALCGLGAVINVAVAQDLYDDTGMWLFAGVCGALVGALVNYALTSIFTWGHRG
jgi:dolichol-phosphate mannosyltransferase